jgi:2-alkyl-3-oxoalkanoate reductase
MRIAVTGASGVLGQEAVEALCAAGHEVTGVTRRPENVRLIEGYGATAAVADVFDEDDLVHVFRGHDVVMNALAATPSGVISLRPGAWKEDDKLHLVASQAIVSAAIRAGVDRLVQESIMWMYPDSGPDWITEQTALAPKLPAHRARLAELRHAVGFATSGRTAVVLRLGQLYGRDRRTTETLHQVRAGKAVLLGSPEQYVTPIHHSDAGAAFVSALRAGSGIYNVGGQPLTRRRWATDLGREAGAAGSAKFFPEAVQLAVGSRLEDQRRSLRVSSLRFMNETGWAPTVGPSTPGWSHL